MGPLLACGILTCCIMLGLILQQLQKVVALQERIVDQLVSLKVYVQMVGGPMVQQHGLP